MKVEKGERARQKKGEPKADKKAKIWMQRCRERDINRNKRA